MTTFTKLFKYKTFGFYTVFFLFFGFAVNAQTVQTFSVGGVSSTWTCPTGVTSVTGECWGAGGGGGGAATTNPAAGGGGGGGGYAKSVLTVVPGTAYTYSVGNGGNAGAARAAPAGRGTPSWFNTTSSVYADGGKG